MAAATIFIVDDDVSVRKALTRLIRSSGWNVEAFASADEFLARPPFNGTGCLVLDVRMPKMTGPELHERIVALKISLPVIFLTGHGDVATSVREMKMGAVDFLVKPVDDEALLQAIRLALERHTAGKSAAKQHSKIQTLLQELTPREYEVMQHVIAGSLNKQIADELGIAVRTIKVHRGRVMQKMQVASVAELVYRCEAAGVPPVQSAK